MEDNCIFCKIVKNEIPSYKVYEDDLFLAFLDIKPLNPGNSLLIPKDHYRWVYEVPNFGAYWQVAHKIALATIKSLNADSISFLTLGHDVPHAHIRIVPRFQNDSHAESIDFKATQKIDSDQMTKIAKKITLQIIN